MISSTSDRQRNKLYNECLMQTVKIAHAGPNGSCANYRITLIASCKTVCPANCHFGPFWWLGNTSDQALLNAPPQIRCGGHNNWIIIEDNYHSTSCNHSHSIQINFLGASSISHYYNRLIFCTPLYLFNYYHSFSYRRSLLRSFCPVLTPF